MPDYEREDEQEELRESRQRVAHKLSVGGFDHGARFEVKATGGSAAEVEQLFRLGWKAYSGKEVDDRG